MSFTNGEFLSPAEAWRHYKLEQPKQGEHANTASKELAEYGIAAIEMPLSPSDFQQLSEGYAICLAECPEIIAQTAYKIDSRFGSEAGHTRKERKISPEGVQTEDPKNYIHFNEQAWPVWQHNFQKAPQIIRDFLADGFEIHQTLIGLAKNHVNELSASHPHMSDLLFPEDKSFTFMRLVRYDAQEASATLGPVAKPHYDIGSLTVQAYADAPGFWGAGHTHGDRIFYNTAPCRGQLFAGAGHRKIYGSQTPIKPLWHGVERVVPAGVTLIPERTAVILFIDAPFVDYRLTSHDTLPQLD